MPGLIIKQDTTSALADLISPLLQAWISMLALGGLGHRLHIPQLLHIGYWDVLLAYCALVIVRSSTPSRWKVTGE
jgi:uncharacterized membrane protein YadS